PIKPKSAATRTRTQSQTTAPPPKAGDKRRVPPAVEIDVDANDSPVESDVEGPKSKKAKHSQRNSTAVAQTLQREEQEDEDEDDARSDEGMNVDTDLEHRDNATAPEHLEDEAVTFTANSDDKAEVEAGAVNLRTSATTGADSHFLSDNNDQDNQVSSGPAKTVSSRRAQQLNNELPQVNPEALPTSRAAHASAPSTALTTSTYNSTVTTNVQNQASTVPNGSDTRQWMDRTVIEVTHSGRTYHVALTGQPAVMRQIMDKAIILGKQKMLLDDTYSPLGPELKHIAHAAMIDVAEAEGFDGENNVCDHLESGNNEQYIKPLVNHVAGRIGMEQKTLKNSKATVLAAFGLSANTGHRLARNLASANDKSPAKSEPQYNAARPFQHPVFVEYIAEAFFNPSMYYGRILAQQEGPFRSSNPEKPDKLELPKGLVALASAAIHACLQEHASGFQDNFPTRELDGVWKLAVKLLRGLEEKSRSKYHGLMHSLYLEVMNASTSRSSVTNEEVYAQVDWEGYARGPGKDDGATNNAASDKQPPAVAPGGAGDHTDKSHHSADAPAVSPSDDEPAPLSTAGVSSSTLASVPPTTSST
ncbi:hypothetical protein V5O48_018824, partial [Marasmius crinis-equi]